MSYNGNNRGISRRKSEHRRAYKSGEKLLGGIIVGLLGLGVMTAREIGDAAQNAPSSQTQRQDAHGGWGCLIPAAIVLVSLNVLAFSLQCFPLICIIISTLIMLCLYEVFEDCAIVAKKLPIYAKILFWMALLMLCFACPYIGFGIMDISPNRPGGETEEECWNAVRLYGFVLWAFTGLFQFSVCLGGYISGLHKEKKKRTALTQNNLKI